MDMNDETIDVKEMGKELGKRLLRHAADHIGFYSTIGTTEFSALVILHEALLRLEEEL
jgi:hypothetical protein